MVKAPLLGRGRGFGSVESLGGWGSGFVGIGLCTLSIWFRFLIVGFSVVAACSFRRPINVHRAACITSQKHVHTRLKTRFSSPGMIEIALPHSVGHRGYLSRVQFRANMEDVLVLSHLGGANSNKMLTTLIGLHAVKP